MEISKVTGAVTPVEPSSDTVTPSTDQGADTGSTSQSETATKPTQQAGAKPDGSNGSQDKQEATEPHDHDHDHEESNTETLPTTGHTHSGTEATTQHTHTHTDAKVDPATVWVVVGLIAVTMVGAFFAVRKKH